MRRKTFITQIAEPRNQIQYTEACSKSRQCSIADGVSKSLCQKCFMRERPLSAGKNIIFRYNDGYKDSAHQSQNKHNFPAISHALEFLNEAEKEKNNGKGNSALVPSRFASLSGKHSGKTKQITNWSISTFKGKLKFYRYK